MHYLGAESLYCILYFVRKERSEKGENKVDTAVKVAIIQVQYLRALSK
jgi:hypothetical protein